ncbi:MAG: PEGA domain-containing protein [Phycisphaerales bacterium]
MTHSRRRILAALLLSPVLLGGCLERQLLITSEPPGAAVTVNDIELGRTPLEADFTFYGDYDVLVTLDGHEPIREKRTASAPLYEYPPIDLLASAVPARIEHKVRWHYVLAPSLETTQSKEDLEHGLLERARAAQNRLEPK